RAGNKSTQMGEIIDKLICDKAKGSYKSNIYKHCFQKIRRELTPAPIAVNRKISEQSDNAAGCPDAG
ncbi:hypothetical protein OFM15_32310, partial [Escherichia coli]|nr:hypothetical protein [Escherichia coli]